MSQHITNEPGILRRIVEVLSRLGENLDLARELKRRGPEGARQVLQERGLMAR
jgi:hypothetical protein